MRLRSSAALEPVEGFGRAAPDWRSEQETGEPRVDASLGEGSEGVRSARREEDGASLRGLLAAIFADGRLASDRTRVVSMAALTSASAATAIVHELALHSAELGYRVLLVTLDAEVSGGAGVRGADADPSNSPAAIGTTLPIRQTAHAGLSLLDLGEGFADIGAACTRAVVVPRLRAAAAQFDLILLDAGTVPPEIFAGLAAGSDGAVLFVRRHETRLRDVDRVLACLATRGVQPLGTVMV